MSEDVKQMIVGFGSCLLGLAILIGIPASCTAHRHEMITQAIKAGADPIAAKCAIEGDTSQTPVCIIKAQEKK